MPRRVTIEPVGREVDCGDDQTILDACLRAGVWLPHACTHGTCGTCKARIVAGEVDHGEASPFALMDFERDEGMALLCSAIPLGDVVVEADVEAEPGVELFAVEDRVGRVVAVEEPGRDIRRLRIALDRPLRFNAGQYVSLKLPGSDETRSYSLANPPSVGSELELHVKRTPGGKASDGWIFSRLAVGDSIELAGPFGRFFLRPQRSEPVLMVAGGTGLAPLMSMIRHILDVGLPQTVCLYHGARSRADLYDADRLADLAEKHPGRLRYVPCLSEEAWDGRRGLVTEVIAEDFSRCAGHVAYVCGPPPMVDATLKVLMERRLFPRDIYREDFYDESDKANGAVRSPLLRR